jgi:hypothetical protein
MVGQQREQTDARAVVVHVPAVALLRSVHNNFIGIPAASLKKGRRREELSSTRVQTLYSSPRT